jgi:hypothetical protein
MLNTKKFKINLNNKSAYFLNLSKRVKEKEIKNIKNKSQIIYNKILGLEKLNRDYSLYSFNKPILISELNKVKYHITPNIKAKLLSSTDKSFPERYNVMTPLYDNFSKMFFLKRNQSDFLKNKSIQIHKFEKKKQYISLNRIKFNENVLSIIGRGIITNKKIIQNNASQ